MTPMTIAIQIVSVIVNIYIAFSHRKKNILMASFLFNFLHLTLVFIVGDFSTVYSLILINLRSFVYLFQDKIKQNKLSFLVPFGFAGMHILIGIISIEHWYQILTMIAPIIISLSLWYEKNRQRMRFWQSASDSMWLVYNGAVGLYIICVFRFFIICASIAAMVRNRNQTEDFTGEDAQNQTQKGGTET